LGAGDEEREIVSSTLHPVERISRLKINSVLQLRPFSVSEWMRMRPLLYAFKQVRNDFAQNVYVKRLPEGLPAFLRQHSHLEGKNVVLIVAFEQALVLDFLLGKANQYLTDAHLLVFDNSRKPTARTEIERVCREHGVSYFSLPPNATRHPNRSHGMAMTWIFQNVVLAIKPRVFAFIDHDLIPLETVEFGKLLGTQQFYGAVKTDRYCNPQKIGKWGWALWAGYCMFDFSSVKDLPLNFSYDFSRGLDTGGRNWHQLYKNYDHKKIRIADSRLVPMTDPVTGVVHQIQIVDGRWFHFRGASYRKTFQENVEIYKRLADAGPVATGTGSA